MGDEIINGNVSNIALPHKLSWLILFKRCKSRNEHSILRENSDDTETVKQPMNIRTSIIGESSEKSLTQWITQSFGKQIIENLK